MQNAAQQITATFETEVKQETNALQICFHGNSHLFNLFKHVG